MGRNRGKKLPIGIEDFEELIRSDFYYIDKTGLIRELLENWGAVNLFTRPRRFGKSLNMSMLRHFLNREVRRIFLKVWRSRRKRNSVRNSWGGIRLSLSP